MGINKVELGDEYDPIPYHGNARIELDKFYIQDGVMYRGVRDSGIAVHESLNILATDAGGKFVEEVV